MHPSPYTISIIIVIPITIAITATVTITVTITIIMTITNRLELSGSSYTKLSGLLWDDDVQRNRALLFCKHQLRQRCIVDCATVATHFHLQHNFTVWGDGDGDGDGILQLKSSKRPLHHYHHPHHFHLQRRHD